MAHEALTRWLYAIERHDELHALGTLIIIGRDIHDLEGAIHCELDRGFLFR